MIVFSGSSNKSLATKIAKGIGCNFGAAEITRFANGEVRVFVSEEKVGKSAIVVQSLSIPPDEHLVEFVFLCDALKRMGVKHITGVIPWLGYSKQDKVFRDGESLSVKVIAKMLQVAPLERIITFDLHNPAILGFFDVPVSNLSIPTCM
jgi:ribose-phosphate pyrophosphokinase